MSKLIEETMLVLVDTVNNNNKFYHVTLDENNVVTKRWGRVGADGTSSTENTGRNGYDRAINAKMKKGYKKSPVISTSVTIKSDHANLEKVATQFLAKDPADTTITSLISRLVRLNQHQIMEASGGQIKVDDDGTMKTALGIVDTAAINEARRLLREMQKTTSGQTRLLEDYLTLIPQNIGYRRGWEADFLRTENYAKQADFLKQLEDAVQWRNTTKQTQTADDDDKDDLNKHADLFRMRLAQISDTGKEFDRINKLYRSTINQRHTSRDFKLVNVFAVEDVKGKEDYEKAVKDYGNVQELWHGTLSSNILSILTKGLYVPNAGDGIKIAGRMFGNGVYHSLQSSKALNYSSGFWGGQRTKNAFMLLNDVVLGHEFKPRYWNNDSLHKAHKGTGPSGKPYQSINIAGGTCGVLNNEIIVWNTDQVRVSYLCEFEM